ncbi:MAG TPA: DUF3300 domain-containing protein [Candidatus Bathyarchaeia archaeon]|nr:DUF3300 domain-containing protein [Candidatus Bathyarchaeia archaeon]
MRIRTQSAVFCFALVLAATPLDSGAAIFQATAGRTSDYSGQGMPFSPQELQSLVAPIALYPDPLVAQILAGATYPDQIVAANDFVQHKGLSGHTLMEAVALEPWDPSVKALTEFPTVLSNMAVNLAWTSQLGECYHNAQSDLMMAIQGLRGKAVTAGNLASGPQLRVNQPTPDIVALQPANPQVIYLPLYNPAKVFGTPVATPNYSSTDNSPTAAITFGGGVAAGALTAGAGVDWSAANWTCNWYHGVAYFHDYPYNGNNAWHGSYYGGYNYYGNHTYRTSYDNSHPYTAFQGAGSVGRTASGRETGKANAFDLTSGWSGLDDVRGWGDSDTGGPITVFSSWDKHAAASMFAVAGWGDRAASFRGWLTHGGNGGGWGTGGRLEGTH